MNILFVGDVVGSPGRKILTSKLNLLKKKLEIDFCIANGENASGGAGIARSQALEIHNAGVDVITLGNHTYTKKEILNFIDSDSGILRPANFAEGAPGKGSDMYKTSKGIIGVINLLGRVYMDPIDCPFKAADREIAILKKETKIVIIDFHAEATSEKAALAWYVDGRVSLVAGTHTHVQTADEHILPFGTAFITDTGMTGPCEGVIGVDREIAVKRFVTGIPIHYQTAVGRSMINAVSVSLDPSSGKALSIRRILVNDDDDSLMHYD